MNPAVIGVIVAAALIAAFVAGNYIDFDGGPADGPAEKIGEAIDDAANN